MWEKKKILKPLLWTKFVHINMKIGRSESHSKELTELFEKAVNPLPEAMDFEQRVEMVKGKSAEEDCKKRFYVYTQHLPPDICMHSCSVAYGPLHASQFPWTCLKQ